MKRCKSCQVEVLDETVTCPLCNRVLSDDGKTVKRERMYPDPEEERMRLYGIKNIFFILLGMIAVLMGIINYITYNGFLWSAIVLASILYLMVTVSYSSAEEFWYLSLTMSSDMRDGLRLMSYRG